MEGEKEKTLLVRKIVTLSNSSTHVVAIMISYMCVFVSVCVQCVYGFAFVYVL